MKKIFIVFLLFSILTTKNIYSQKGEGALAAAGIIAGIAGAALAVEQVKEEMELFATNYILENFNYEAFNLEINGLTDGSKFFDPSSISVISFNVSEADLLNKGKSVYSRTALLVFFDYGWRNEFGIDITKVKFMPFNKENWNPLYKAYLNLVTGVEFDEDKLPIFSEGFAGIKEGVISIDNEKYYPTGEFVRLGRTTLTNRGVKGDKNMILPFPKVGGDTYLVSDYSDELKVIFNEKSMGFFFKDTGKLVQLKSSLVSDITRFVNR